jgi:hypothetical protein
MSDYLIRPEEVRNPDIKNPNKLDGPCLYNRDGACLQTRRPRCQYWRTGWVCVQEELRIQGGEQN